MKKKSQVVLIQGSRGGAKSTLAERLGEEFYKVGHLVVDILGAPNGENCYWVICKYCKKKLQEGNYTREERSRHCKCDKRFPTMLITLDYVKFDDVTLKMFNGEVYTKEEWRKRGNTEWLVNHKDEKVRSDFIKKITKPSNERDYPWLIVRKLPVPTTRDANKDSIVDAFAKYLLEARDQRRVVVMNPMFFKSKFHLYKTLELIIKGLEEISIKKFKPLTPLQWKNSSSPTIFEENYHRMVVIMREFGSVAPAQLKVDQYETLAKKAILGFIRLCRHYNISLIGDYQRQADVFAGIKEQRDVFIWRRSNMDLIPDDWKWLPEDIEKRRTKIIEMYGRSQEGYRRADQRFPKIDRLSNGYCYVVFQDNHYRLMPSPRPSFHHHEEGDNFETDTGIKWWFDDKIKGISGLKMDTGDKTATKVVEDADDKALWNIIDSMLDPLDKTKKKKVIEAYRKVKMLESQGRVRPLTWHGADEKTASNNMRIWYARNKKKYKPNG